MTATVVDESPARPLGARSVDRLRAAGWGGGSGPAVAALFHRALGAVFLVAWLSLGSQVRLLVGSRGLLPLAELVDAARAEGALSPLTFPSLLALAPSDAALVAGVVVGAALAVLALLGIRPRLCAALGTALYLGYVTACRTFLGFQWDNLLLECGLLATFLPTNRRAPVTHFLMRALLFKLYFESGIAKWQSPLGDWRDGSAMTSYYETAPLPTALAWRAHHLPRWWHLFESRATLALELGLPFLMFGPRRARLGAAGAFTLFQAVNAATANYGFFCYLTAALHLFLLDDADVVGARRRLAARLPAAPGAAWLRRRLAPDAAASPSASPPQAPPPASLRNVRRLAAATGVAAWLALSLAEANLHFGSPGAGTEALLPALELAQTFRLVSTYHLFASITRERVEPTFEAREAGGAWRELQLRYKPGDVGRAPPFVAPHQPRVDFQLWFYGLARQRRMPIYVATLLGRLCEDPTAVQPLFTAALPPAPDAVRVRFWNYRFTSPEERRATHAIWTRREVGATPALPCTAGGKS